MAGIKITQLAAYSALGANETTVLVMVDPADPTMAPSGTTRHVTGSQVVGNYQGASVLWPNATVVIGPDPGGTQRLRVQGGALISGGDLTVGGNVISQTVTASVGVNAPTVAATTQLLVPVPGVAVIGTDPGNGLTGRIFQLRVGGDIRANTIQVISPASDSAVMAVGRGQSIDSPTLDFDGTTFRFLSVSGNPMPLRISTLNATGMTVTGPVNLNPGPVIIGTDPGGTELLRVAAGVSGSVRFAGAAVLGNTTTFGMAADGAVVDWDGGAFWIRAKAGRALRLGANNADVVTITTAPAVIIGTDPGGTESFRVGGAARVASLNVAGAASCGITAAPGFIFRVVAVGGDRLIVSPQSAGSGVQIISMDAAESGILRPLTVQSSPMTIVVLGANSFQADGAGANNTQTHVLIGVGGGIGLQRVSIGAADSGGAGFRVLRVPN